MDRCLRTPSTSAFSTINNRRPPTECTRLCALFTRGLRRSLPDLFTALFSTARWHHHGLREKCGLDPADGTQGYLPCVEWPGIRRLLAGVRLAQDCQRSCLPKR